MPLRSFAIAAIAACFVHAAAQAASDAPMAPVHIEASVPPGQAALVAYRKYVRTQTDLLVGMTRVLVTEIRDGNVEAAQAAYAPAHRYFERIAPVVKLLHELDERMNARAEDFAAREADPAFSGFHRIEYGLFSKRSTAGLAEPADRLNRDARALREQTTQAGTASDILFDEATMLVKDIPAKTLSGHAEPYSRTDLWDLEANIDGMREIMALMQPRFEGQKAQRAERTAAHFARINDLLEKHKDGCGFKTYDALNEQDRTALKSEVTALAEDLSRLRGPLAMD